MPHKADVFCWNILYAVSTMPMCERLKYRGTNQGGTRKEQLRWRLSQDVCFVGNYVSVHNQQFVEEFRNLITKRESLFLPLGYEI